MTTTSPRAAAVGRDYAYATSYSMPPSELTGVAAPEQAGVVVWQVKTSK